MPSFAVRHIGPDERERFIMLQRLGFSSLDELTDAAIPEEIRCADPLRIPEPSSEAEVQRDLAGLAAMNNPGRAMIGLGYHGTVTPPAIRRHILSDPGWYTSYTPYQPEISQGRLEAHLNFQTMIADLTRLPVAGSSLLDESTAVAEAVALARRATRKGEVVVVDSGLLPQSMGVLRTRAAAMDWQIITSEEPLETLKDCEAFAVVLQIPGHDGLLPSPDELRTIAEQAHQVGALVVAAVDPLLLSLMTPPGEWGADVAVGSTQRFGVPLFFGGPHAGFMAVRKGLERQMPGRLVGVSKDDAGTPALRLALQTREQHIRRERATSNICTSQALLAVVASMYAVHHGPEGLTRIAREVSERASRLAGVLRRGGWEIRHKDFFDTITVETPGEARKIVRRAREEGIHLRQVDEDAVGVSVGEDSTQDDLHAVAVAFDTEWDDHPGWGGLPGPGRTSHFLTNSVFHDYRSETEFMRYIRSLRDRDFALDKGMIPLGSCTMKLSPTAAMEPITYPGFADLHPFVPPEDATGYAALIERLELWLTEITGYDNVSLQPNAGSQGEFAGLMAIRSYHLDRGEAHRNICLIPASAHGTNAASAVMAGMKVAVVGTNEDGSIDFDDLAAKIATHRDSLSTVMITYPSTHGVFEARVPELCDLVHAAGGQVYVDGANFNALLGLARPGRFGADVSHLNLHKTFAIPHGGGGPGVGPVAVRSHLAPFLPNHPLKPDAGPNSSYGPISGGPWGSAGVLPITYAFIALMGGRGLRLASQTAVLTANYVGSQVTEAFPVLYSGRNNLVAHECILDIRPLTKRTGITVDDVAKRLIDYGFHAPTMSFPVAGTLMVEPTESEALVELERFVAALKSIRAEADRVGSGEWPADDNPLANSPHTLSEVTAEDWTHPYTRHTAAFPAGHKRGFVATGSQDKYFPPVGRIDGAFGDRNLLCSCPPLEVYRE